MERGFRRHGWLGVLALCLAASAHSHAPVPAPTFELAPDADPALAEPGKLALDDIGFLPAENFDLGDGLPALSVVSAAVTGEGQVWLGTMRGLARYNSRRFVAEPGPDGAFLHAIGDIAATPDGRVWVVVPGRGLYVRKAGVWHRSGRNTSLGLDRNHRVRAFPQRQGYRLLATGRGSLHEWDGTQWLSRKLPAELAATDIFDVLLQPGSTGQEEITWLATFGKGLWRCSVTTACAPVEMPAPGPRFNEISSLEQWIDPADGSAILWVASYGGGLARLQHGVWRRYFAEADGLPSNFLQRLQAQSVPGQPPHLWVGTRSGLAHRVGERWAPLDAAARFDGATVKALAAGRTARGVPLVWIGSDKGSARLRLVGPWRTVSQVGARGNGVWSLLHETRADGEQFWLGSDGEGLSHYSSKGWRRYTVADGLPSDMVRSMARDGEGGDLLVGTWGGEVSRFDGKRFHRLGTPWPKSDHEAVSVIRRDRDALWFALRESGLARLQGGKWTLYPPSEGFPARIYDVQRVGDSLWVSTNTRGLARIDERTGWQYFGVAQGNVENSFFGLSLVPDAEGRDVLWAGSLGAGAVRVDVSDPLRPMVITQPALPTPPDPFVYGVVPDGRGNLFVSTNYGASLWQPRPHGEGYEATDFHRGDGLPHDENNYGALHVDSARRIWLGTLGGLGVFTPMPPPAGYLRAAPLTLERLSVNGSALGPTRMKDTLVLPNGAQELSFELALHTGEREAGSVYRSQMLGLEPNPTPWTSENQRSFTALPAGDYRLRMEARDAFGLLAAPIELGISIPLPFWRTTPALLLFSLALVATLYLLLRLRERRQRLREQLLVGLVRQRTSELETRGVELRRINEELTRLSYHDPLTDLANRRMLLERLHGEWELAQARGSWVAFLLFDLDQFKAFNDQRGHLAGDDCLREIGRRIDAELHRPSDTAGRYGGEEFGVVLPGMTLDQAVQAAERIRYAVESAGLPHPGTPQGVVTISVGVAAMVPRAGFSAELLIAAADAALYRAKAGGKNRVEAAASERQ